MPTIFAHGAIGFTAAKVISNHTANRRLISAAAILAMMPDVDGLFFGLIPYRHPFGHRGFTHSLLFAALAGVVTAFVFVHKQWNDRHTFAKLAVFFSLVTASHGVFDAMTTGGLGVAFLSPFDNTRYFFPFRPIPVSPMSADALLTRRGMRVLSAEFGFFWTFAAAAALWEQGNLWRMIAAAICASLGVAAWLLAGF
jgi:inner membrane protein